MTKHDALRLLLTSGKQEIRREMQAIRTRIDELQAHIGDVQLELLRYPSDEFIASSEFRDLAAAAAHALIVPSDLLQAHEQDDGRGPAPPTPSAEARGPHRVSRMPTSATTSVDGITGSMYDAAGRVIGSVTVTGK
jgi:hypothetical protein